MRPRLHLDPLRAFDLALAGAALVIAIAAFFASAPPHAVLGPARDLAARMPWRSGFETGLLLGLGSVALMIVAVVTAVVLLRRRSRRSDAG